MSKPSGRWRRYVCCPDCASLVISSVLNKHRRGRACHARRIAIDYVAKGLLPVANGWAWFMVQLGVEAHTDVSITENRSIVQACYVPAALAPVLSLYRPASGKPGKTKLRALMPYARVAVMCAADPVVRDAFEASRKMGTLREFVESIGKQKSNRAVNS